MNKSYFFSESDSKKYEKGPSGIRESEVYRRNNNGELVEIDKYNNNGRMVEIDKVNDIVVSVKKTPSRHVQFSNSIGNSNNYSRRMPIERTLTPYPTTNKTGKRKANRKKMRKTGKRGKRK